MVILKTSRMGLLQRKDTMTPRESAGLTSLSRAIRQIQGTKLHLIQPRKSLLKWHLTWLHLIRNFHRSKTLLQRRILPSVKFQGLKVRMGRRISLSIKIPKNSTIHLINLSKSSKRLPKRPTLISTQKTSPRSIPTIQQLPVYSTKNLRMT